jgi:hypothetical protein
VTHGQTESGGRVLAVNTGARAPRGGVARQSVVLTDLQSLCECQQNFSLTLSPPQPSDTDARAIGCVVMVEEAACDSHTILMVAICHLLVQCHTKSTSAEGSRASTWRIADRKPM